MFAWLLLAMMMQQGGTFPQDQAVPLYSPSLRNICEESMSYGGETVAMKDIFEKCGRSKPEPMDVPVVSEEYVAWESSESCRRPKGIDETKCETVPTGWACSIVQCDTVEYKETRYTCADKSRVLLTAEDGTRHCIKFKDGKE